jgi:hypothetical protein
MNWFQKLSNWLFGTPKKVDPPQMVEPKLPEPQLPEPPKVIHITVTDQLPQQTITIEPKVAPPIEFVSAEPPKAPEPVAVKPKAKKSTSSKPAAKKTTTRKKS